MISASSSHVDPCMMTTTGPSQPFLYRVSQPRRRRCGSPSAGTSVRVRARRDRSTACNGGFGRPEPALGGLEATAPPSKTLAAGTRTLSKTTSAWPCAPRHSRGRQHALDDDSRMRQRHQDHRLPAVAVRVAGRLLGAANSHFSDLQMSDRLRPKAGTQGSCSERLFMPQRRHSSAYPA